MFLPARSNLSAVAFLNLVRSVTISRPFKLTFQIIRAASPLPFNSEGFSKFFFGQSSVHI
jgi:hypothetical protein